jgi:hypothetical protein
MDGLVLKIVNSTFPIGERELVLNELKKLTIDDVMAKSSKNLLNAHLAILKLSDGDASKVSQYTSCAKKDFRDVIYWASEE